MYGPAAALSGEVDDWSRAHLSFQQRACAVEVGEAAVVGATSAGGQQVIIIIQEALRRHLGDSCVL